MAKGRILCRSIFPNFMFYGAFGGEANEMARAVEATVIGEMARIAVVATAGFPVSV